jgi:hypothetical protein
MGGARGLRFPIFFAVFRRRAVTGIGSTPHLGLSCPSSNHFRKRRDLKMLKTFLSVLLAAVALLAPGYRAMAKPQKTLTPAEAHIKVAKLGLGEKARATITLKNGTKVKGYVARVDDNEFVIRDKKTDTPTTIRYEDVVKVDENRGHSMAKNLGLGIAIGIGAVILVALIAVATFGD